jgi:hypothetical protein
MKGLKPPNITKVNYDSQDAIFGSPVAKQGDKPAIEPYNVGNGYVLTDPAMRRDRLRTRYQGFIEQQTQLGVAPEDARRVWLSNINSGRSNNEIRDDWSAVDRQLAEEAQKAQEAAKPAAPVTPGGPRYRVVPRTQQKQVAPPTVRDANGNTVANTPNGPRVTEPAPLEGRAKEIYDTITANPGMTITDESIKIAWLALSEADQNALAARLRSEGKLPGIPSAASTNGPKAADIIKSPWLKQS